MRDIDILAASSFKYGMTLKKQNTKVIVENGTVRLYLHGNCIAARPEESVTDLTLNLPIRWQSHTTKSRINGVLKELDFPLEIKQVKSAWYFINTNTGEKTPVVDGINFIHK